MIFEIDLFLLLFSAAAAAWVEWKIDKLSAALVESTAAVALVLISLSISHKNL